VIVGVLGDVHGNMRWLDHALFEYHRHAVTTIIQVGDLGIWWGSRSAHDFTRVSATLVGHGQTMLVTPGNHDDYDIIDQVPPREDGFCEYRPRILLAPRGLRSELGGRNVLWLGGAASVDRGPRLRDQQSTGEVSWWAREAITGREAELSAGGGHADLMVCHDCPADVPELDMRLSASPAGWDSDDLAYSAAHRALLASVVDQVRPHLLLHGHYHFAVAGSHVSPTGVRTRTFGVGMDGHDDSLAILDLDTMEVGLLSQLR